MGNETCSYDPTFGLCCNTCVGYNYTEETIPDGYILDKEPCINCSGEETFRIIPNPCDGFMDCGYLGPEPGAETCLSGTITKYDNCKPCPNLGNLSSCPTGYKCEYEKCSNKYYKVDGCQSGYDWNSSSKTCTEHCYYSCSLSSCPDHGYCSYESCTGKYCLNSCERGWDKEGDSCTCKNKGTYSSCPTGYVCSYETCSAKYYTTGCDDGYDKVGDKCEKHVHVWMCEKEIGNTVGGNLWTEVNKWGDQALTHEKVCAKCYELDSGRKHGNCYKSPKTFYRYGDAVKQYKASKCTYYNYSTGARYEVSVSWTGTCYPDDGGEPVKIYQASSSSESYNFSLDEKSECEAFASDPSNNYTEDAGRCTIQMNEFGSIKGGGASFD